MYNNIKEIAFNMIEGETAPVSFVNLKVEFSTNELFEELLNESFRELNRLAQFERINIGNIITYENYRRYCKTILKVHVDHVNGVLRREYSWAARRLTIPLVLGALLMHIGRVEDRDYGIRFIPSFEIEAEELMAPSEFEEFSRTMEQGTPRGFEIVKSLIAADEAGSLEFMAISGFNEHDRLVSYKPGHPVFGFLRSFFNTLGVEQILGASALRIDYGTKTYFQGLIHEFVFKTSVPPARKTD